jgi:hypothetical protein
LLRRSRDHFRVRLACSTSECKTPPAHGEGCAHNLDFWFKESVIRRQPRPAGVNECFGYGGTAGALQVTGANIIRAVFASSRKNSSRCSCRFAAFVLLAFVSAWALAGLASAA